MKAMVTLATKLHSYNIVYNDHITPTTKSDIQRLLDYWHQHSTSLSILEDVEWHVNKHGYVYTVERTSSGYIFHQYRGNTHFGTHYEVTPLDMVS